MAGDFVYDGLSLPTPKYDARPLVGPANESLTAAEWRSVMDAMVDLRAAIVAAKYHAFTEEEADVSAPGTARIRYFDGDLELSLNGGAYVSMGSDFTLGPIAVAPDDNGIVLVDSVLSLTPADGTHGGVIVDDDQQLTYKRKVFGKLGIGDLDAEDYAEFTYKGVLNPAGLGLAGGILVQDEVLALGGLGSGSGLVRALGGGFGDFDIPIELRGFVDDDGSARVGAYVSNKEALTADGVVFQLRNGPDDAVINFGVTGSMVPATTGVATIGTAALRFGTGYASTWDGTTFQGGVAGSSSTGATVQGFTADSGSPIGVVISSPGAGMGLFTANGKIVSFQNGVQGEKASVSKDGDWSGRKGTFTGKVTVTDSSDGALTISHTDTSGNAAALFLKNDSPGSFGTASLALGRSGNFLGGLVGYESAAFGLVNGVTLSASSGRNIGFRIGSTTYGTFDSSGVFNAGVGTFTGKLTGAQLKATAGDGNGIAASIPTNTRLSLNGDSSGVHAGLWSDSTGVLYVYTGGGSSFIFNGTSGSLGPAFNPLVDNYFKNGTASNRWADVVSVLGTFSGLVKSTAAINTEAFRMNAGAYMDLSAGAGTSFMFEVSSGIAAFGFGLGSGHSIQFSASWVRPSTNNSKSMGTDPARWSNVYSYKGDFNDDVSLAVGAKLLLNPGGDPAGFYSTGDGNVTFWATSDRGYFDSQGLHFDALSTATATSLALSSTVTNGASAVGTIIDTANAFSSSGALLLSARNATTEKFSVDKDGWTTSVGGGFEFLSGNNGGIWAISAYSDLGWSIEYPSANTLTMSAGNTLGFKLQTDGIIVDKVNGNIAENGPLLLQGNMADGASAVAVKVRSAGTWSDTGSKLFQVVNNADERFAVPIDGGANLRAGTGTALAKAGGVLDMQGTSVGNVGGGEDTLHTYSLPANSLSTASRGLRWRAMGQIANNANAKTLKVYFGSVIGNFSLPVSINGQWTMEALIVRTGTDSQRIALQFHLLDTVLFTAAFDRVGIADTTEDDGSAITMKLTGTATSNDDIQEHFSSVEYV